ncbi:MAG: hypothetical protein OXN17_22290 [Candidatus Poribacteria bacterium]|nr:hypothetical protein [Candidatus Poribacteria bacterium]
MTINSPRFQQAETFLTSYDTGEIAHFNGDFFSHLRRTADLLVRWGNTEYVCLAGLCHAVYGTQGFQQGILEPDERHLLQEVIGLDAEGLAYFYCSCDRSSLYPTIGASGGFKFHDRFTGDRYEPSEQMVCDFLEVTFSNEVELGSLSPEFVNNCREFFQDFMPRCKPYVSQSAFEAAVRLFELPV